MRTTCSCTHCRSSLNTSWTVPQIRRDHSPVPVPVSSLLRCHEICMISKPTTLPQGDLGSKFIIILRHWNTVLSVQIHQDIDTVPEPNLTSTSILSIVCYECDKSYRDDVIPLWRTRPKMILHDKEWRIQ